MRCLLTGLLLLVIAVTGCSDDDPVTPEELDWLEITVVPASLRDCPDQAFTARVGANFPLDRVEFRVDGDSLAADDEAPFEYLWNLARWADGEYHYLSMSAWDVHGRNRSRSYSFHIPEGTLGVLLDPAPGGGVYDTSAVPLRWMYDPAEPEFEIMLADEPAFAVPTFTATTRDTSIVAAAAEQQWHYWRVRQRIDEGEWEPWSETGVFWSGQIFERLYSHESDDGSIILGVEPLPDGGYLLVGAYGYRWHPYLWCVDELGERLWSYEPHAEGSFSDTIALTDGGCVATGTMGWGDACVVRLAADGSEVWNRPYLGSDGYDAARCVIACDGGFLIAGSQDNAAWAVLLDDAGWPRWERTYGDGVIEALYELPEGGFVMAGETSSRRTFLLRTDAVGDALWQEICSIEGFVDLYVDEARIVLLDDYNSLRFHDLDGAEISVAAIGRADLQTLLPLPGGGFLLGGTELLIETDGAGLELWRREEPGTIRDLAATDDGGIVCAGDRKPSTYPAEAWLVKMNADLEYAPPPIEAPESR